MELNPAGPELGDAFGMQLSDSLRLQRPVVAYVERSDGLITPSGSAQWLGDEESWPPAIRELLGNASGRVLDIGAGGGRHSAFLAGRSCDVTVLDNSPLALGICRERGIQECVLGDIGKSADLFRDSEPFRTVLLLGNNVGLLGSAAHGTEILRQLHDVTAEDALILAEGRRPVAVTEENHAYVTANRARGRLPGELLMRIRYRTTATSWFPYLFCDPSELALIAQPAGWEISDVEDFRYPGSPPAAPLLSYTAVLRKSGRPGTDAQSAG
ncbi:class I SAM-dependent methyltransferase [Streptomyces scopuliridis]|uniref:class I SAM-dependent methyltransferase n=1 Tax=Streptomyces scopuliridis TaxID=452529 RepID=UPI000B247E07|nr:class I SAM-dependent methyltransferase [Streptomyces scopuliridis]